MSVTRKTNNGHNRPVEGAKSFFPAWLVRMKQSRLLARYVQFKKEVVTFLDQLLCKKKILIISDNHIINIPIGKRLQSAASVVAIGVMLWVSYSTGKYFAFENIIEQKEKQLWTTSMAKENLQYQVSDLNHNLRELNKYFDNIQKYDQLAEKDVFGDEANARSAVNGQDVEESPQNSSQRLLYKIRSKVHERIGSLESIIDMTGVNVERLAESNQELDKAIKYRKKQYPASSLPQGGPYIPILDGNEAELPDEDIMIDKEAFNSDINYLLQLERMIHVLPLAAPIKKYYYVTSRYGRRIDPVRQRPAMHYGLDLAGRHKGHVYSGAPGVVLRAGLIGAYGRLIEIDHGFGITTRYGHLNKIFVKKGDRVKRGQAIGLQGSSGRSTGSHLHYEVRLNQKPFDPYKFLKAGKYVF